MRTSNRAQMTRTLVVALMIFVVACGDSQFADVVASQQEIINGDVESADSSGLVQVGNICTGILQTPQWVITARHCMISVGSTVWMGSQHATVDDVLNAPDGNDVAMLHLDAGLVMPAGARHVQYIRGGGSDLIGKAVKCYGYGDNSALGGFGSLRSAYLEVSGTSGTFLILKKNPFSQQLYYGDSGGACFYDYKGPEGMAVIGINNYIDTSGNSYIISANSTWGLWAYHVGSEIFNWKDYLARYDDLRKSGINTGDAAWQHWKSHGITECRQAHRSFNAVDFLRANPSVLAEFGWNCVKATELYMLWGRRVGLPTK